MCRPWTLTTAFNRGCHWSTALLTSCWSRLAQQVYTVSLRSPKPTHRTAGYSCQLFNISGTFAKPRVVLLTAYQFSYALDILLHSDSPLLSATGLPTQRDRVRCDNLAQKISNRTDCPILARKIFTNTFCTLSFSWYRSLIKVYLHSWKASLSTNCDIIMTLH